MTIIAARLMMALAVRSLGAHRGEWAKAMATELDAAEADRRPLRFAAGCLLGAWRTMSDHAEGRFALTSHALCLGLLVPMAAMLALAAIFGFPFVQASDGVSGFLSGTGTHVLLLNAGSRTVGPALTLIVLMLAGCHLPLAWWVLDRDWERAAAAMRFGAATMTALAIVTSCVALDPSRLLVPLAALAIELCAVSALVWWHAQLGQKYSLEEHGTAH